MKIAVWKTGHEIADTIARTIWKSDWCGNEVFLFNTQSNISDECINSCDAHIAYGILRGCDNLYRECDRLNKPWFNIDKGYWNPGHYDGYYRVSLRGTQQTTGLDKLEPDYARWDKLGIEILDWKAFDKRQPKLVCPPTQYVHDFFDLGERWKNNTEDTYGGKTIIRYKDSSDVLQDDLNRSRLVYTFNSSVGWEALRQGIPVVSDETHSIVGVYQKLMDKPLHVDYDARRKLFALMSSLQLTLDEMRSGLLWPLLSRLLSTSVTTHANL